MSHDHDAHRTLFDEHLFGPESPCFGCAPHHPIGFHLRFSREGDEIVTHFTPGEQFQGPPGIMHGGLVATLADELAAWAVIGLLEKFGFTASFEARFRSAVRIGVEVVGRAKITKASTRLVDIDVSLRQAEHEAFHGAFRFVLLDERGAEKLLGGPIPDAWKKWCR